MRAGLKLIVLGVALTLVATACERESGFATREIVAKDYSFQGMPATIQGGAVTVNFRNEGKTTHELAFLDIGNATFEQFEQAFGPVLQGGPLPSFLNGVAAPIEIGPGDEDTRTFTLPAGRYLLMCAVQDQPGTADDNIDTSKEPPHYKLGMHQFVTVEGGGGEVEAPDGTITAKDYTFDVPSLTAGDKKLVFRNAGPKQFHFGELEKFGPGVTPAQAMAAFKKGISLPEGSAPPPGLPQSEAAGFSGIFSPGNATTWDVSLQPGTYLLACFLQDRAGGPPHAIKYGMYKAFTVKAK